MSTIALPPGEKEDPTPARLARRFDEVDESLPTMREKATVASRTGAAHTGDYFGRQGQFAPDMVLFCERFAVVELIAQQPWPALPVI